MAPINWEASIPKPTRASKMDEATKCRAVSSLLTHLNLTTRQLLDWLFGSDDSVAIQRANSYLSSNGSKEPVISLVRNIWTRFSVDDALEEAIDPIVRSVLERESKAGIECRDLSIQTGDMRLDTMVNKLGSSDAGIQPIIRSLMPRSYSWLLHATSADNRYRRLRLKPISTPELGSREVLVGEEDDDEFPESGSDWHTEFPGFRRDPRLAVVFSLCTMLHVRNSATNAMAMCLSTQMTAHGANTRVTSTFSRLGATVSRRTMDRFRIKLSDDAVARGIAAARADARWLGVIDNIDLNVTRTNQRIDHRNHMLHITNFALIRLPKSVPLSATAVQPYLDLRGKRAIAQPKDIKPTLQDDLHTVRAFEAVVHNLVLEHWPGAKNWRHRDDLSAQATALMPVCNPLAPDVTETYPLGVLNSEESSLKGTLRVLELARERLTMTPDEWAAHLHIMAGDFLTTRNLRSVKTLRTDDVTPTERVETILPQAQLFHFALNAADMLLHEHLGDTVHDAGSLSRHKDVLLRTFDMSKIDYAHTRALIRHSLISRVIYCMSSLLGEKYKVWNELEAWDPTPDELRDLVSRFIRQYATSKAAENAREAGDNVHVHNIYFIVDALRLLEFDSAVAHGDAGRVIIVLKYWAFDFRGAGKHNYARECAEIVLLWIYELNDDLRCMWAASWFINRWGRPGRFIATDLYLEHLNFFVKVVHLADGSGVNVENMIKKGSSCVEALRDISLAVSRFVGDADVARRSKEKNVQKDLMTLFNVCKSGRLAEVLAIPERFLPAPPPTRIKKGVTPPRTSSIQSLRNKGSARWNGTWAELLDNSTFDPQLGSVPPTTELQDEVSNSNFSARDLGLEDITEDGIGGVGGSDFVDYDA